MLLVAWFDEPHRATRDVDLLGIGNPAHDALLATFREVMTIEADDGVTFDIDALRIEPIREELEYGGSRLRTTAALAGARIPITVDIESLVDQPAQRVGVDAHGGSIMPFCEPLTVTSTPHSSWR